MEDRGSLNTFDVIVVIGAALCSVAAAALLVCCSRRRADLGGRRLWPFAPRTISVVEGKSTPDVASRYVGLHMAVASLVGGLPVGLVAFASAGLDSKDPSRWDAISSSATGMAAGQVLLFSVGCLALNPCLDGNSSFSITTATSAAAAIPALLNLALKLDGITETPQWDNGYEASVIVMYAAAIMLSYAWTAWGVVQARHVGAVSHPAVLRGLVGLRRLLDLSTAFSVVAPVPLAVMAFLPNIAVMSLPVAVIAGSLACGCCSAFAVFVWMDSGGDKRMQRRTCIVVAGATCTLVACLAALSSVNPASVVLDPPSSGLPSGSLLDRTMDLGIVLAVLWLLHGMLGSELRSRILIANDCVSTDVLQSSTVDSDVPRFVRVQTLASLLPIVFFGHVAVLLVSLGYMIGSPGFQFTLIRFWILLTLVLASVSVPLRVNLHLKDVGENRSFRAEPVESILRPLKDLCRSANPDTPPTDPPGPSTAQLVANFGASWLGRQMLACFSHGISIVSLISNLVRDPSAESGAFANGEEGVWFIVVATICAIIGFVSTCWTIMARSCCRARQGLLPSDDSFRLTVLIKSATLTVKIVVICQLSHHPTWQFWFLSVATLLANFVLIVLMFARVKPLWRAAREFPRSKWRVMQLRHPRTLVVGFLIGYAYSSLITPLAIVAATLGLINADAAIALIAVVIPNKVVTNELALFVRGRLTAAQDAQPSPTLPTAPLVESTTGSRLGSTDSAEGINSVIGLMTATKMLGTLLLWQTSESWSFACACGADYCRRADTRDPGVCCNASARADAIIMGQITADEAGWGGCDPADGARAVVNVLVVAGVVLLLRDFSLFRATTTKAPLRGRGPSVN